MPLFSFQQTYGTMLMCKVCLPNFACVWEEVRLRCKIRIVILICASINQFIIQRNKSDVYNEPELKMSVCALKFFPTIFRCLSLTTQMKLLNNGVCVISLWKKEK